MNINQSYPVNCGFWNHGHGLNRRKTEGINYRDSLELGDYCKERKANTEKKGS